MRFGDQFLLVAMLLPRGTSDGFGGNVARGGGCVLGGRGTWQTLEDPPEHEDSSTFGGDVIKLKFIARGRGDPSPEFST